ncbi:MAG: terminase [Verrucomicrobiae bacterium]|nr:terminase [Verrucomicrobiae bacterium]
MAGWLVSFIMSTRPFSQGTVTATTNHQLQSKTWAQIAKWAGKGLTGRWFELATSRGSMIMRHPKHKNEWFCAGQTCKEENSEAFAGQHAATGTSFYLFDEASGIPDKIWEVAEGGTTDGEPMWFAFGNRTKTTGGFHKCFANKTGRWKCRTVDSRSVQVSNKNLIQKWIDEHGADSDFIKVRVRGLEPDLSINQLISRPLAEVAAARELSRDDYQHAPIVLGVDPAWMGRARSVIVLRQGLYSVILFSKPKVGNVVLADLINQFWIKYDADACFIDMGWGAGVIDVLRSYKKEPIPVSFGAKLPKTSEWVNKRAEIWCRMEKWLREGGRIENRESLIEDLVAPEKHFEIDTGRILLEDKESMFERLGFSPDEGDALATTFAAEVQKKNRFGGRGTNGNDMAHHKTEPTF